MRKIGWRVSAALCVVAGVAAALAARQGRDVRRLDLSEVRAALRAMGAIVRPDVAGRPVAPLGGQRVCW